MLICDWSSDVCSSDLGKRQANREAKIMDSYLKYLGREAALGRLSRREFLGRSAALGVALPMATTLLGSSVLAAGPQRGGHLKCGLQGGASTDVLDPAKCTSQVCFLTGRNWGDTLLDDRKSGV